VKFIYCIVAENEVTIDSLTNFSFQKFGGTLSASNEFYAFFGTIADFQDILFRSMS
jgi:hypothetical protein